jgi:hypothetical protein
VKKWKKSAKRSTKLHLSDDHLVAIAHVAVRGNQLDTQIQSTLVSMSYGLPERVNAYITGMTVPNQIGMLEQVLKAIFPTEKAKIEKLIGDIRGARKDRNDVIHAGWAKTDNEKLVHLVDLSKPEEIKRRNVTSRHIHKIADHLFDLFKRIHEYWFRWLHLPFNQKYPTAPPPLTPQALGILGLPPPGTS